MMAIEVARPKLDIRIKELCSIFEQRAQKHDFEGSFVNDNYADLKSQSLFSAMVPEVLGGGGMPDAEMCKVLRKIGASCGSTALTLAMHQHLVAASRWKFERKRLGAGLLEKVAMSELVLVSTGARDWLSSNGKLDKVEGGFTFTAKKSFASGSLIGDIAITSAPYEDPDLGMQVLHFPVSLQAAGVSIEEDWQTMGMRGTGSHSIQFHEVFVPEDQIALRRAQGGFHMVWDVVLTVAMPLIMSAYVGIAERARQIVSDIFLERGQTKHYQLLVFGKLTNELIAAQVQLEEMIRMVNNFDFDPDRLSTSKTLSLKTNVAEACIAVVQFAMEVVGGQGFYQRNVLERLFRDVQAAQFHPLPKWDQYNFSAETWQEQSR